MIIKDFKTGPYLMWWSYCLLKRKTNLIWHLSDNAWMPSYDTIPFLFSLWLYDHLAYIVSILVCVKRASAYIILLKGEKSFAPKFMNWDILHKFFKLLIERTKHLRYSVHLLIFLVMNPCNTIFFSLLPEKCRID